MKDYYFCLYYNLRKNSIKNSKVLIILEIIELLQFLLMIDIVFNSGRDDLHLYFVLYYLSPVLYFEQYLTTYGNCTSLDEGKIIETEVDQISKVLNFTFNNTSVLCNFDNDVGIWAGIFCGILFFLALAILLKPEWKRLIFIQKLVSFLLYLCLKTFLYVFFYLFTKKPMADLIASKPQFTVINIIWIILFIGMFVIAYYFCYYCMICYQQDHYILNYSFRGEFIGILLKFLIGSLINLRHVFYPTMEMKVICMVLFILNLYAYFNIYKEGLLSSMTERFKFFGGVFFICLGVIKCIASLVVLICGKDVIIFSMLIYQIWEIVLTFILFFFIYFTLRKILAFKNAAFSFSHIVNEVRHLSHGSVNPVLKLIQIFASFFEGSIDNPDVGNIKDANFELLQYKKSIIRFMKEELVSNYLYAEGHENNNMRTIHKKKLNNTSCIEENRKITVNVNNNIHTAGNLNMNMNLNLNFTEEKNIKKLLFRNIEEDNVNEDFKTIIKALLSFAKLLKRLLKSKQSAKSEIIELDEILVLMKIILFYTYDQNTFRADFYIKKYLSKFKLNVYTLKFYIVLKYLDTKFKEMTSSGENNWILLMKYIELHEKFSEILKILKYILKNFDGQSKVNKLKIMDSKNEQLGDCYRVITAFTNELNDKFKIQDQSTFLRYKMANHFLFNIKDYDKFTEDQDMQLADLGTEKNTYFVLHAESSKILIHKIPRNFIEATQIESKQLIGEEFHIIFPKSIREHEKIELRKTIMNTGECSFSKESVILRKDGYVILADLTYFLLPIITDKVFFICNLDFRNDNSRNCILVNDYGDILHMGPFLNDYFGINPDMNLINIIDLFNTNEPLAKKFKKNFRREIELKNLKEMKISIHKYKEIYSQLNAHLGIQYKNFDEFGDLLVKECVSQINEIENNNMSSMTPRSSIIHEIDSNFHRNFSRNMTVTLYFHFRHSFTCPDQANIFTFSLTFNKKNAAPQEIFSTVFLTRQGDVDILNINHNILLEMPGTTFSISNTSMSSFDSKNQSTLKKISEQKKARVRKTMSILGIIITSYNAIMIALAIALLLVVQNKSTNLKNVFEVLKSLRQLNSIYFNEAYHLTNLVKIENYQGYNSYEVELKRKNPKIKNHFEAVYQKEFRDFAAQFYPQFSLLMSQLNDYVDSDYVNNVLNVDMEIIQLDGVIYTEKLFSAVQYPIISLYILSTLENYYESLPFFYINRDHKTQFDAMGEFQKRVYKELLNYPAFRLNFHNTNVKMRTYFIQVFEEYEFTVYLIFAIFIFLHVISFLLYIYDANLFYFRIFRIAKKAFKLDPKSILAFLSKVKKVKKLINLEEKASIIVGQLRKEIEQRKIELNKKEEEKKKSKGGDAFEVQTPLVDKKIKKDEKGEKKRSYPIKAFSQVIIFITMINLVYVIYSIMAFPIASNLIKKIRASQDFTINIVEIQRISVNYFLTLKVFMMMNNTAEIFDTNFFYEYPSTFFENLQSMEKLTKNEINLNEIDNFFNVLHDENICTILMPSDDSNKQFDGDLYEVCMTEPILQSNIANIFAYFIRSSQQIIFNFYHSERTVNQIVEKYHSDEVQQLNLICILFIQNFINQAKDTYGMTIYTNDIDTLVLFAIILFILMVVTECINFILIRIKVVNRLRMTLENYSFMDRFFSNR